MWSLEEIILHHACLLDAAFVSLYIFLIEMGLLSLVVPFFRDVSSHGKIRQELFNDTTSWFRRFTNGQAFLIEKSRFKHFYVTGLISLLCCFLLGGYYKATLDQGSVPAMSALIILGLHLVRRTYECYYVHQWRKGNNSMHLLGYILGAGHYLWLPMIFIKLPCRDFRCNLLNRWDMGDKMDPLAYFYTLLHHVPIWFFSIDPECQEQHISPPDHSNSPLHYCRIPVLSFCLWAQYQQYRHHVLLASLRKRKDPEAKNYYGTPVGGWFAYVVSVTL
jgi:uncharacterized membrane protein (GlpM family)